MPPAEGRTAHLAPAVMQKLKDMMREHPDAISLAQGLPTQDPPSGAFAQAVSEVTKDVHLYTPDPGLDELRTRLSHRYSSEKGVSTSLENIMVTSGANQAFFLTLQAVTQPGDRVVLFAPYYFNYHMAVMMSGCVPVILRRKRDGTLPLEKLSGAMGKDVKAVVSISPDNPTGLVNAPDVQKHLAETCIENDIWLLSDEVYEDFVYEGVHQTPVAHAPHNAISIHSFSKSHAASGWRVGYIRAPESIMEGLVKAQDTVAICPGHFSQRYILKALEKENVPLKEELSRLESVRKKLLEMLESLGDRVTYPHPQGAFYAYLTLKTKAGPWEITEKLLEENGIGVVPGIPFGDEGSCIRISYGNLADSDVSPALSRLEKGIKNITEYY